MVEYRCDTSEHYRLAVETEEEEELVGFDVRTEHNSHRVDLTRDSVAALVGQLQSWLARTEANP